MAPSDRSRAPRAKGTPIEPSFTRRGRYGDGVFPQLGGAFACQNSVVGRLVWSVREGQLEAPEIFGGYRSASPVLEPRLGDVLHLPDGSGPWLVVDWAVADRVDPSGNVLVVERSP